MNIRNLLVLICFFISTTVLWGQIKNTEKIKFSIEVPSFMSYSGVNLGVEVNAFYKRHSLGAGLKTTFQTSFFPYQNAYGIMLDYRYYIVSDLNTKAFVSAHYSNVNYKSILRNKSSINTIHEYTYNLGFLIKVFRNFWLGNSFGFGGYTENYYDFSEGEKENYNGYNFMAKTMLVYEF